MSTRQRATLGAVALALGLLMVVGGSVSKSTEVIKYNRDLERGKRDAQPPSPGGENAVMVIGGLLAVGGAFLVFLAIRDMTRQISDIQSRAEVQMRSEAATRPESKPKG